MKNDIIAQELKRSLEKSVRNIIGSPLKIDVDVVPNGDDSYNLTVSHGDGKIVGSWSHTSRVNIGELTDPLCKYIDKKMHFGPPVSRDRGLLDMIFGG